MHLHVCSLANRPVCLPTCRSFHLPSLPHACMQARHRAFDYRCQIFPFPEACSQDRPPPSDACPVSVNFSEAAKRPGKNPCNSDHDSMMIKLDDRQEVLLKAINYCWGLFSCPALLFDFVSHSESVRSLLLRPEEAAGQRPFCLPVCLSVSLTTHPSLDWSGDRE